LIISMAMADPGGVAPREALTVELLEPDASTDADLVTELCELVNDVYAVAEAGMWVEGATRTTVGEVAELIAAGEILVARSSERGIVGSVRLHDVAADTSEFGILVAARDHRKLGIGRALLDEVERRGRDRGLAAVQLELLVPREWSHPSKEFLMSWYGRRGYRLVRTTTLDGAYPHLAPLLATACDLQIHRKELRPRLG
jgi:GNAT superfamily N-acetyltransferase